MFFRYLMDKKSWILFFLLSLGMTDILIWLDKGIAVQISSLIYLNTLLILSFFAFLTWRWRKETRFTASLTRLVQDMEEDWVEALPTSSFLRDETIVEALRTADRMYKHKLSAVNESRVLENDYMASWVHEVKTPLTALKLMIDANRSDPVVRKMEAEWLRVHLLIDQQLYISRMSSLESDYVLAITSLQQNAAKEIRELASWCLDKNIAVEFEGEDIEVVTDSKWCRFVIRQLLTNAVKYSPYGGTITIAISITFADHAALTIRDEGPGIPPQDLPRIFDKGFTGGNGRLQNAATGIGLYLARTVATKIGIVLDVQSEQGKGTAMQMIFPTKNEYVSTLT